MKQFTLNKQERLKSRKAIDAIFLGGQSIAAYPLRLAWVENMAETPANLQVAFSVPKRNHKHATVRNKLKRRMREAYRLNKQTAIEAIVGLEKQYALILIYTGREEQPFAEIEKKLIILLQKFTVRCNETPSASTNTGNI